MEEDFKSIMMKYTVQPRCFKNTFGTRQEMTTDFTVMSSQLSGLLTVCFVEKADKHILSTVDANRRVKCFACCRNKPAEH